MRVVRGLATLLLLHATVAGATSGTCTISQFVNLNRLGLGLDFPGPKANGTAMTVDFDEAAGTFTMHRDAWANDFPDGMDFLTVGQVRGIILMTPGAVGGTIDSNGTVTLRDFPIIFSTDFCPDPVTNALPQYPLTLSPSTGIQVRELAGQPDVTEGVPLDFTTGRMTLVGLGLNSAPCGSGGGVDSGFLMTCQLGPIPSQTALRKAARLTRSTGRATLRKDTSAAIVDGDEGDAFTLKAKLATGADPLALDGSQDVLVRLSDGSGVELALVRVAGSRFRKKGKRLVAKDTDGKTIQVPVGHLKDASASAVFGGSLTIVAGKKTAALTLQVEGLDLSRLGSSASVTVAVGRENMARSVAVRGAGTTRRFH
jgi:hypothetical protein